jgi:predicted dehydrogenase/nucleoside-diphosphate-sugar epimerase
MIGAGFILKSHAQSVAAVAGAELHLIADTSAGRAQAAADAFGFPRTARSVEEVAASDCDVVHVLLPPFLHEEAAETLIKNGKSVFMEKPMGLDSAACSRLASLAREKRVRFGVNHNFLFGPQYEQVRSAVLSRRLGRLEQILVFWHHPLPQLEHGPFDNWMLSSSGNLLFEIAPHLLGFVLDLGQEFRVAKAVGSDPVLLASGIEIFRRWVVTGESRDAAVTLSISNAPGHSERFVRLRGTAGSAQVDFGRNLGWVERSKSDNPLLEAVGMGTSIARQVGTAVRVDRRRRIVSAIRQKADATPYDETIFRSIEAFYRATLEELDPRHRAEFGSEVIRACENIVDAADVPRPTRERIEIKVAEPRTAPTVLVVGGTGFIGRALVKRLTDRGLSVRVLTRNRTEAAISLAGMPAELVQGSHGDPAIAEAAVRDIKVIYHLAKVEGKRWQDYVVGDLDPTRVLAKAALAAGVQRFIYTGTIDSYASGDRRAVINQATTLDPKIKLRNLYARAKAAAESVLKEYREKGLPLVIFRPGIVVGRGAPLSHIGIARFLNGAEVEFWGNGCNKLPLVLVDDVADALAKGYDAPDIDGEEFLLTGDPLLTAHDYVVELAKHTNVAISTRARPAWRHWLPDFAKEMVKWAIRHPNRRASSLHDWKCRGHTAAYDSRYSQDRLDWRPERDPREFLRKAFGQ